MNCLTVLLMAALAGPWAKAGAAEPAEPEAKNKSAEKEAGPKVSRDNAGRAVVTLAREVQARVGLQLTNPAPARLQPEIKGYGRVLDPATLAGLAIELSSAQVARAVSSNELARLRTLSGQGNASPRSLETAEAAARRDELAVQAAVDKLTLAWGKALSAQTNLPALARSLASLDAALVRIDLPAGETVAGTPESARLSTLSGQAGSAEYLSPAPNVDPQLQGRGFLFLVRSNLAWLAPGEAVVGYLQVPREPVAGVILPRDAVVRTEGAAWVYVLDPRSGEAFTRTEVALDRPLDAGWFVSEGVSANDRIVVTGAQQLLSVELRGGGEAD